MHAYADFFTTINWYDGLAALIVWCTMVDQIAHWKPSPSPLSLREKKPALLEKLTREYGFISKSETIRSAVCVYLNLLELAPKDRLRTLQLINEMLSPSARTSRDLVEEVHKEDDEL